MSGSPCTVLITGAESALGEALAREFSRHGHNLVLVGRCRDRLENIARELRMTFPIWTTAFAVELVSDDDLDLLHSSLLAAGFSINIIVNIMEAPVSHRGDDALGSVRTATPCIGALNALNYRLGEEVAHHKRG